MSDKNVSGIKPVETETYTNGLSKAKVAELETKAENLRKNLSHASDLASLKSDLKTQEARLDIARKLGDTQMMRAIQEEIKMLKEEIALKNTSVFEQEKKDKGNKIS